MNRYVLDANILLSAFMANPGAPSAALLAEVHDGKLEAVACPALIAETRKHLQKRYFRARLSESEAAEAIETYVEVAVMLADPKQTAPVLRDAKDDYLVALARTAEAEFIVTGDRDLLEHAGLQPPAINARTACELLGLSLPGRYRASN